MTWGNVNDLESTIPYGQRVSLGLVSGVLGVNKFGHNDDIDTGTVPEDVWDGGGLWVPPTAARIHDLVSTSLLDKPASTGAHTVRVWGLDANWDEQTEAVTLDGTTPVPTSNAYIRIFRMTVVHPGGTSETNAGDITATAQTDATVTAKILAGNGNTLMAIYTVPAGKVFLFTEGYLTMDKAGGGSGSCEAIMCVRDNTASPATLTVALKMGASSTGSSHLPRTAKPPVPIPEKSDIMVRVVEVTSNDTDISAGFDGFLHDVA